MYFGVYPPPSGGAPAPPAPHPPGGALPPPLPRDCARSLRATRAKALSAWLRLPALAPKGAGRAGVGAPAPPDACCASRHCEIIFTCPGSRTSSTRASCTIVIGSSTRLGIFFSFFLFFRSIRTLYVPTSATDYFFLRTIN